jgi:hypothetical protein
MSAQSAALCALHNPGTFPANAAPETDGTQRRVTIAMRFDLVRWYKIRAAPLLGRPRSECQLGTSQCNMTLLPSTFNSVWSVCRMTKKFLGSRGGPQCHLEWSFRDSGAKKQFIGSRRQDFHARSVVRFYALRRVRALGGCGGGPGCHAIAAQDAVFEV